MKRNLFLCNRKLQNKTKQNKTKDKNLHFLTNQKHKDFKSASNYQSANAKKLNLYYLDYLLGRYIGPVTLLVTRA